ncbi:hypothetical protein BH09BAC3_BH09BAC3_16410 [soil metagenome]
MKRFLLIMVAVALMTTSGTSQKVPVKFGDVSMDEMKMKVYSKDTSAAAVVLFDFGQSTVSYSQGSGFGLNFERIKRIKILKNRGYGWAEFLIPLYTSSANEEEKLVGLKGITYNLENGKIVESKLKTESIFKDQQDENHQMVKIAMPNVKEGSVIEISYTIASPFLYNLQPWTFQSTIPVQLSEYRVKTPEYFDYKKQLQGYLPLPHENTSTFKAITLMYATRGEGKLGGGMTPAKVENQNIDYKENYDRWVVKDVPSFKIEPRMSTYRSYVSAVSLELRSYQLPNQPSKIFNSTWEDLSRDFMTRLSFGRKIDGSGFLNEYVQATVAGKSTVPEKVAAIYSFVKKNVEWDTTSTPYSQENLKRVLEVGKGNSADINLILVSMLKKAGLKVYPVLISTRSHGLIRRENPNSSQFNYVIASVDIDGKYLLLDATDRALPMTVLPERCLNGEGFMLSEQPTWIAIIPTKSFTMIDSNFSLSEEGGIKGRTQFKFDGYFGREQREKYFKEGKETYTKNFAAERLWEISSSDIQNIDDPYKSVVATYQFDFKEFAQVTDNHIYFNPLLATRIDENPFKMETREYPLDFASPEDLIFAARITIPEGWVVDELPKPKIFVLPGNIMKCSYSVSQDENMIVVSSRFSINKTMYSQEEYKMVRDYYDLIVAKHAEQVVLKKK